MADMNNQDFNFKWHAANGNDQARYAAILASNNARIAELEAELETLTGSTKDNLTDMDLLDLELAENRSRAYDMSGATTALSRIDSRNENRIRNARQQMIDDANKAEAKALKRSELEANIRKLQIQRAQAKTTAEKNIIDAQLVDLGNQLTKNGGNYVPATYEGADSQEALKQYYDNTANTKNGRVFLNTVTPEQRTAIRDNLLAVGEYDKAAEVEAKATAAEKQAQKQKWQTTKSTIKKTIQLIDKVYNENKFTTTPEGMQLLNKAKAEADSLARNYPSLVKIENGRPKFIGKD